MASEKEKQLAIKIKVLRAEKGWTQKQLAEHSGVSICAIQYIEDNCKKKPRVDALIKIAKAFKIDPDILIEYIID